jgi:DNA gyrase subunit A
MLIPARSLDTMLFFSDKGKVYSEKVYQIPDLDRATKGIPLVNILSLGPNEKVTAAMSIRDFSPQQYCMLMTGTRTHQARLNGRIRLCPPSGLIAMNLDKATPSAGLA